MATIEVLSDAFGRVREAVQGVLHGIDPGALTYRPDDEANTIAWLVWHLTRVQDDHIAAAAGTEQVWTSQGWHGRFGLPFSEDETGYGQDAAAVGEVRVEDPALLAGYLEATSEATTRYLGDLSDTDLDRVVDERWDPPVTLGVRLVSVIADGLQHAGQAAYLRGLAERSSGD